MNNLAPRCEYGMTTAPSAHQGRAVDVLQRQMVQIRKKLLRPLHLIVRRYPAYHMTFRPQWHASSEKNRIPGLHRPPGHSKLRSSQHMESMCGEERRKSSIIRRFCCVL